MNSQIHSYFAFPEKKGSLVRVQPAPQNLIKIGAVAQLVEIKVYTMNYFLSLIYGSGPEVEGTWFGTKNHRRFESCLPYEGKYLKHTEVR